MDILGDILMYTVGAVFGTVVTLFGVFVAVLLVRGIITLVRDEF